MLNPAGRIVGDLTIACLADDRFMIVGSGFAEEFHMRWFWQSNQHFPCLRVHPVNLIKLVPVDEYLMVSRQRDPVQDLAKVDHCPVNPDLAKLRAIAAPRRKTIVPESGD